LGAAPGFAFVQSDATTAKGVTASKTHQVLLLVGSDYYLPIAIDDQPVPEDERRSELQRLRHDVQRRRRESPERSAKRSEEYRRIRDQNGVSLREFTQAFNFTAAAEETVNGRIAYVFDARPRPNYHPAARSGKILAGMQGRLWIDEQTLHWINAEAEALRPVSVVGIFARALPGTKMEMEMTPVSDSVWLVSRFVLELKLSVVRRKSSKTTETTFRDYEPAAHALTKALFAN
jgi:hypothetical protein